MMGKPDVPRMHSRRRGPEILFREAYHWQPLRFLPSDGDTEVGFVLRIVPTNAVLVTWPRFVANSEAGPDTISIRSKSFVTVSFLPATPSLMF